MPISKLLAQNSTPLGDIGGSAGFSPWGLVVTNSPGGTIDYAANQFTFTFSRLLSILTIIAGLWFLINLLTGAYGYLTAGGNQDTVQKASQKIVNSLIGLIVVIAAYALTSLVGSLLGYNILNPQQIIPLLKP